MEDIDLDILDDFFDEDVEFNLYEIFKTSHVDKMYKSLQKLIQAYEQDEIIIDRLAGAVAFYRNDSVKAVKEEYRKIKECE